MATPNFSTNPLVQKGIATTQQLGDWYTAHGTMPRWQETPGGIVLNNSGFAKQIGYTNPGVMRSVVGTTASRPATSGQPGTGVGTVFTPTAVNQALQNANVQGATTAGQNQLLADLYQQTGVTNMMAGQPSPALAPAIPTPGIGLPADPATQATQQPTYFRGRGAQIPEGTTTLPGGSGLPQGAVNALPQGSFGSVQDFVNWFSGQGPRQAGAPGQFYNLPAPVLNANNEFNYPGLVGQTFGNDQQWLSERVQAQMLMNGIPLPGPASQVIPPHLLQRAGYGPESVLGGDWSVGQRSALPGFEDWIAQQPGGGVNLPGGYYGPGGQGTTGGGPGGIPPTSVDTGTPGGGVGSPGGGQPPPSGGGGQPPPTQTSPITGQPIQPGQSWIPGTSEQATSSVDNSLAYLGGDIGWLRGIAENAGYATDTQPAWDAMVAAQQRNLDRRFADLKESFNVAGNRFSSDFNKSAVDFWGQAGLDQNALLGQLTLQAQEAARGRELSAAQGLGQMGFGGLSQLSNQDFQAQLQAMQQAFGAGQSLFGAGAGAAGQLAGQGAQGALAQLQAAMQGAQGLYGTEVGAAMQDPQFQLALQQLGLSGASSLSDLWQQNLQTGLQVGGAQYGLQQDQIDRLYQEWLRTQSTYNPLLPYMYASATGYPPVLPQQPSMWGQVLGQVGAAGVEALAALFGG